MTRTGVYRRAERKTEHSYRASRRYATALAAVLALAALLRFYDLGEESLWVDELSSLSFASPKDAAGVIGFVRTYDVHPPLYYLVLHYSRALFGESEAALRLPSAVAGVLAVGILYLLGRRLYSRAEGLAAALFTAVAWWPVAYSQDARNYSLLLFFSALSAFFWWGCWQALRERFGGQALWEAAGYIVAAIALCYTHYFGLFLVLLQCFALLARAFFLDASRGKAFGVGSLTLGVVLLYVPVALAYLPWLSALVEHSGWQAWFGPPRALYVGWFITDVFGSSVLLTILCAVILALGVLKDLGVPSEGRVSARALFPSGLLVAWFAVPVLLALVVSLVWTPIFYPRNLIICLPAAYLLLGRSVVLLSGRFWPVAAVSLAALFLAQLILGLGYYREVNKEQYREAARYAASFAEEETVFAQCGWGGQFKNYPDRFGYYFERFGAPGAGPGTLVCTPERVSAVLKRFETEDKSRLVYLSTRGGPKFDVVEHLRAELGPPQKHNRFASSLPGPKAKDFRRASITVWVFEMDKASSAMKSGRVAPVS